MKKTFTSHSLAETSHIAEHLLAIFADCKKNNEDEGALHNSSSIGVGASVVGLNGHLGSGKTAFVQAVANILGIKEPITSPTFVIMKLYDTENTVFPRLVHIDAYRLEKSEELQALRFEDLVADPNNLILIEWSDNVSRALPADAMRMDFEAKGENEREIIFTSSYNE